MEWVTRSAFGVRRWWVWASGDAAEFADGFFDGADGGEFDAEVFADFDGLAFADGAVVGEQFEVFVGGFAEFDDGTHCEAHDFADGHAARAQLDDDGDFDGEEAMEFWDCREVHAGEWD